LSLKLLIDEDSQAKVLVSMLRKAGHNVVTVNELGLMSQPDEVVLDYARQDNRIVLTHNCQDFEALHETNPNHSGIFVIYENDNSFKDMSRQEIVKAIFNLEAANISLVNQFISLNQWKY
jgi:predicted nuclease of predicted toxin-antitoxin system